MFRPPLLLALVALALGGCGGSGSTTTNESSPPPDTETVAPVGPVESEGPHGSLGTSSIGPVTFGMTMDEVEDKFGKPDDKQEVSFAATGEAPQIDWIWKTKGGVTRVQFQTKDDTVTGYRTFSPDLETEEGFGVGTPIDEVNKKYGDLLRDGVIGGPGTRLLSEGEPGTYPGITFAYNEETGEIYGIEGGMLQPAGD